MRGGYKLGKGDVKTAAQLVSQDENVELRRLLPARRGAHVRQAPGDAEERQPAPLPRRDRAARHRVRHRPGGHGQDLPRDGAGGRVPARQARQPHHPRAPGGRGGREARVPARRPAGEGQSVPAAAVRRALRHDGDRARRPAARARHDRGRADRLHARPHAERRVRHPRRGAEHHVGADEDVPDAPRLRIEGGHHRRRHADRPADGARSPASSRR